ncbi:MAG: methyltransferase domain-containing protein [Alphaproteobacteria bacterium]
MRPLEASLVDLFQHLGIDRAHVAAGQMVPNDWLGLAARYPERIASLTLVSPRLRRPELEALGPRFLVLAGDAGPSAQGPARLLTELTQARSLVLRDYECLAWSDLAADRGAEIASAWLRFLDGLPLPALVMPEGEGEVAGISYRGSGPPLVLMPLDLAPAQWEPLIPELAARYSTISLGGPLFGVVAMLESRGRSNYLAAIRAVLDLVDIKPGETVLEVGGGSGVALREIARRTGGANPILDIDINPYLLREAAALTAREGLAGRIEFRQGSAEALPLANASVDVALALTVMEEGDADRMMAELVRVTRPGGRIGAIVRSQDMSWWSNLPLSPDLRAKIDRAGVLGFGVSPTGCADASLYRRFCAAGLVDLRFFPQHVSAIPEIEPIRVASFEQQARALLSGDELAEWDRAAAVAKAEGSFFIAQPHHCAVGTKPR